MISGKALSGIGATKPRNRHYRPCWQIHLNHDAFQALLTRTVRRLDEMVARS